MFISVDYLKINTNPFVMGRKNPCYHPNCIQKTIYHSKTLTRLGRCIFCRTPSQPERSYTGISHRCSPLFGAASALFLFTAVIYLLQYYNSFFPNVKYFFNQKAGKYHSAYAISMVSSISTITLLFVIGSF